MKPIAAILTLAGVLAATEADAQLFHKGRARSVVTSPGPPAAAGYTYSSGYSGVSAQPTAPVYHYSYYVSPPLRARDYQGFGTNDFPFYGAPYGHPYDPWTWPYMSDAYSRGLARYYDPPVSDQRGASGAGPDDGPASPRSLRRSCAAT